MFSIFVRTEFYVRSVFLKKPVPPLFTVQDYEV